MKSRCFKLYRAYSISFNSSNLGNFIWSWILKDCIEAQKKKKVVALCTRPPQKVNQAFTRRSHTVTAKKCTKKAWCTCKVVVLPIETYCSVLRRPRWRHRRRCLSTLIGIVWTTCPTATYSTPLTARIFPDISKMYAHRALDCIAY